MLLILSLLRSLFSFSLSMASSPSAGAWHPPSCHTRTPKGPHQPDSVCGDDVIKERLEARLVPGRVLLHLEHVVALASAAWHLDRACATHPACPARSVCVAGRSVCVTAARPGCQVWPLLSGACQTPWQHKLSSHQSAPPQPQHPSEPSQRAAQVRASRQTETARGRGKRRREEAEAHARTVRSCLLTFCDLAARSREQDRPSPKLRHRRPALRKNGRHQHVRLQRLHGRGRELRAVGHVRQGNPLLHQGKPMGK